MFMQKKKKNPSARQRSLFLLDNTHCVWEVSELHPGGCSTTATRDGGWQGLDLWANLDVVVKRGDSSSARERPYSPSSWGQKPGGEMGRGGGAAAPLLARSISVTVRCGGWPGWPG